MLTPDGGPANSLCGPSGHLMFLVGLVLFRCLAVKAGVMIKERRQTNPTFIERVLVSSLANFSLVETVFIQSSDEIAMAMTMPCDEAIIHSNCHSQKRDLFI